MDKKISDVDELQKEMKQGDVVRMSLWGYIGWAGSSEEPAPRKGHLSRYLSDMKEPAWE